MKEKILEIFNEHLELKQSGYLNGICELKGKEGAAEAITILIVAAMTKVLHSSLYAMDKEFSIGTSDADIKAHVKDLMIGIDVVNKFGSEHIELAISKLK